MKSREIPEDNIQLRMFREYKSWTNFDNNFVKRFIQLYDSFKVYDLMTCHSGTTIIIIDRCLQIV